ncbi:hypothetical protein EJ08DRAFT_645559 [Tothia fuscella]|uniref:Uncharacterized protein n=1 Tax=Tothia fuscella TaxID=1048955 RepID=A0A9P4P0D6_9PEZI|nr:hypothetical protein EJ08DRAFT_645559 [Tothia fuscella]
MSYGQGGIAVKFETCRNLSATELISELQIFGMSLKCFRSLDVSGADVNVPERAAS